MLSYRLLFLYVQENECSASSENVGSGDLAVFFLLSVETYYYRSLKTFQLEIYYHYRRNDQIL